MTVTTKEYLQKLDELLQELLSHEKALKEQIQADLPSEPDSYQMYQADWKFRNDPMRSILHQMYEFARMKAPCHITVNDDFTHSELFIKIDTDKLPKHMLRIAMRNNPIIVHSHGKFFRSFYRGGFVYTIDSFIEAIESGVTANISEGILQNVVDRMSDSSMKDELSEFLPKE